VVVVLGEGGSGGALAVGVGDRVLMMENSVYSVISPEGCAAILWKDAGRAADAAEGLRLTAPSLRRFGIVDSVVPESSGGEKWELPESDEAAADGVMEALKAEIVSNLKELAALPADELLRRRYGKYRAMGEYAGGAPARPDQNGMSSSDAGA
jgi:acetyl-CoA carboxylase carboxyl transferase subunit alpha